MLTPLPYYSYKKDTENVKVDYKYLNEYPTLAK